MGLRVKVLHESTWSDFGRLVEKHNGVKGAAGARRARLRAAGLAYHLLLPSSYPWSKGGGPRSSMPPLRCADSRMRSKSTSPATSSPAAMGSLASQ